MKRITLPLIIAAASLTLACGSDDDQQPADVVVCAPGTTYNPITGECAASANNSASNATSPNPTSAGNTAANTSAGNTDPNTSTPANTSNTTPENNSTVGPAGPIDPMCIDGQYTEVPPTRADISDLVAGYTQGGRDPFVLAVLERRYPIGAYITEQGQASTAFNVDCIDAFVSRDTTGQEVIGQLSTVVHECGHFHDIDQGGFGDAFYAITDTLSFTCPNGDTTSRGGATFARSRINTDAFASARPKCNNQNTPGCDFYADVYLDGDPDDGMFDGGDQGFNSVLEEATQYVNSLATGYAFGDFVRGSVSERDGILTFMWYIGRYLNMARTQYPDAYEALVGDPCWREAILTVWGRGWLFLELTKDESNLGISDAEIERLVLDSAILDEIQRVRDRQGCSM